MSLREKFENEGQWLFERRSYLPIGLTIVFVAGLLQFDSSSHKHVWHETWVACCLGLSLTGLALRVSVVGYAPKRTSGRNTSRQIAATLNTTGLYSIVRHPLYLGNFLIWMGIASYFRLWWLAAIVALTFWIYYERIMLAEERFLRLKFEAEFVDWAARTPAFLPDPHKWRRPALSFSLRMVLRKEYPAMLGICLAFALLELGKHLVVEHRFCLEPQWHALAATGTCAFGVLRFLKKHTSLLVVAER